MTVDVIFSADNDDAVVEIVVVVDAAGDIDMKSSDRMCCSDRTGLAQ